MNSTVNLANLACVYPKVQISLDKHEYTEGSAFCSKTRSLAGITELKTPSSCWPPHKVPSEKLLMARLCCGWDHLWFC